MTRSDFAVKFTIYDFHQHDGTDAGNIVRDFRELPDGPTSRLSVLN